MSLLARLNACRSKTRDSYQTFGFFGMPPCGGDVTSPHFAVQRCVTRLFQVMAWCSKETPCVR